MPTLSRAELNQLHHTSLSVRQAIIQMLVTAKSGHSAGPLGMTDVFTVLYNQVLKHKPKQPDWAKRDRVILSNGHICPVLYATLADQGYFPKKELASLRKLDSRLQGHPHYGSIPGVESSSGPLGQGVSQACGLALAWQRTHHPGHVYCFMSDAELQEGQTWEALMFGAAYQLTNLTMLIDRNHIQIGGRVEEIMPIEPVTRKLAAFGWQTQNIDGHDYQTIYDALLTARSSKKQPTAIVCHTIPGKGASFMENDYRWHGQPPNDAQAEQALAELRSLKGKVSWD